MGLLMKPLGKPIIRPAISRGWYVARGGVGFDQSKFEVVGRCPIGSSRPIAKLRF